MGLSTEKTAVMVVRAWIEGNGSGELRARITRSLDISAAGEQVSSAASVDEVVTAVRNWLDAFVASAHN